MGQNKFLTLETNQGDLICCCYTGRSVGVQEFSKERVVGRAASCLKHFIG